MRLALGVVAASVLTGLVGVSAFAHSGAGGYTYVPTGPAVRHLWGSQLFPADIGGPPWATEPQRAYLPPDRCAEPKNTLHIIGFGDQRLRYRSALPLVEVTIYVFATAREAGASWLLAGGGAGYGRCAETHFDQGAFATGGTAARFRPLSLGPLGGRIVAVRGEPRAANGVRALVDFASVVRGKYEIDFANVNLLSGRLPNKADDRVKAGSTRFDRAVLQLVLSRLLRP